MQNTTDNTIFLRRIVIITAVVGLLSLFSLTVTTFAYGTGQFTLLILLLFPAFIVSTILMMTKVRFGYFATLLIALTYATLLNRDIGDYFVFSGNDILILVLLLPYLTCLFLIPTTVAYLTVSHKQTKLFSRVALLVAVGFFAFAIIERANMDYKDSICMDFDLLPNGQIKITGKPGFADSRQFSVTSNSKELAAAIKDEGELFYGSYVFVNTRVRKNFHFSTFHSLTVTKLKDKPLNFDLTWKADELKGDVSFLQP